jgi:tRNA-5-methyluridine54 2-sulfurtransferase
MAKCNKCSAKAAIISRKAFCKNHFVQHFEGKVLNTIKRFNLISRNDRIIVGSSGGKDSTTLLYLIKKYFGKVEALAIDEGIPGYRNITLDGLRKFCASSKIPLHIHSYKQEFGFTLAEALKARKDTKPCNLCGILRRYLLNSKARGFTKIATGHNLDDEAQSIIMNIMKAQTNLLSRLGPVTGNVTDRSFIPRIKPLYFCSEKEVATYAAIKQFGIKFTQCPHSVKSFRAFVRDRLNDYEASSKGAKARLVSNFIEMLPRIKATQHGIQLSHCARCGEPSSRETCNACITIEAVKSAAAKLSKTIQKGEA